MDMSMQAKLLRMLEEKTFKRVCGIKDITVDVRLVSATNQELSKAMSEGKFRKDLYYRLQVVPITVPPLRNRGRDVLLLAYHFINYFSQECHKNIHRITREAEEILLAYPWPGNVRELKNVIERAMILEVENEIQPEHLPQELLDSVADANAPAGGVLLGAPISLEGFIIPESGLSIEEVEHALVRKSLDMANGNQTKAAQLLKMPRDAFRRRMKRFGLI
jgi:two-component system response regulator AtoC